MYFKNIKEADKFYKYPMSYRMGSIYNEKGIIRSYSNGKNGDYKTNKYFYYKIKNDYIKSKFSLNLKSNQKVRLLVKTKKDVEDFGLLKVSGFYNGFVKLLL